VPECQNKIYEGDNCVIHKEMSGIDSEASLNECERQIRRKLNKLNHSVLKSPWGKDAVGVQGCK